MRGVYTAGVLDYFNKKGLTFDCCIGVSAGALHATRYLSNQPKKSFEITLKYLKDKEYCSIYSLIKTGNLFGVDLLYNKIPKEIAPLDNDYFKKSKVEFRCVITDIKTGKPSYPVIKDFYKDMKYIQASSSLPLLAKNVIIDNNEYLAGGITDSRVKWSLEMENKSVSPNWLKIDENGLVKWDANSTVGVYSFKVVAVSIGVNSSGRSVIGKSTKTFTLSVEYDQTDSIDISGSSEIKSDFGKSSKSDKYTSTVHSSGLANPNVKWILEMEDDKGVPQWIKLEENESSEDKNAYILWEESLPEGQYKLVLKAYSLQKGSETVFGKINITLTITKPNESNKNKIILWSIVAASAVVALGILTFIIIKVHKNKKNKTGLKK